eukprot:scaffold184086_cov53-Attheya_sp.AAC.1
MQEIKQQIADTEKEVKIVADDSGLPLIVIEPERGELNMERDTVPSLLDDAGVSLVIWTIIHDALKFELAPKLAKVEMFERKWSFILMDYKTNQIMVKGYVGWGLESGFEKNIFKLLILVAKSASNANLIASNVLAKANAILNPLGIFVQSDHRNKTAIQYSPPKEGMLYRGGSDETNRA